MDGSTWDNSEPFVVPVHLREPAPAPYEAPSSYEQHDNRSYNDNRKSGYCNRRPPQQNNYRNNNDNRNNYRGNRNNFENDNSGGNSDTIEIDPSKVGSVIGRGGSKIREIQDNSGARVNIDKNTNANGNSLIRITGDASAIQRAKDAITEVVNDDRRNDRGGRGGGGWGGREGRGGGGGYNNYDNKPYNTDNRFSNNYGSSNDYNGGQNADVGDDKSVEDKPLDIIDWDAMNEACDKAREEKWAVCPKLIKSFYKEHESVANLTRLEIEKFREDNNNIVVDRTFKNEDKPSDPIPNPIQKFEHCFSEYPDLLEELQKQGFQKPSPIQSQAWPVLLKGEDLIGIAQTGTGKTLAFLLPALIHIEYQPVPRGQRGGPNVLIMAPTRELALQIEKEVTKYQFRGIKAVCLYGGGERQSQINTVQTGVEIIICTPGRLNDLVAAGYIDITSITYLVLDEADRMLDMGFEPQIRKLLLDIRPDRQTVMTSATWPPGVRRLAQSYMSNPIQVYVGSLDLAAVHSVTQIIEIIDDDDKYPRIMEFARNMAPDEKAIIFCGKKTRADDLSSEFALAGISCQSIHGDREQCDREQALADIKSGEVKILVATDVASRGIDIEDITHVVNYDFPRNIEEYVHRVGRTGRAGRTGVSLSFITRTDWGSVAELITILEEADQDVSDELRDMAKRFAVMKEKRANEKGFGGRGGRGNSNRTGGGRFEGGRRY